MPAPGIGLAGIARASLSGNIVFTHDQPHKVRGLIRNLAAVPLFV